MRQRYEVNVGTLMCAGSRICETLPAIAAGSLFAALLVCALVSRSIYGVGTCISLDAVGGQTPSLLASRASAEGHASVFVGDTLSLKGWERAYLNGGQSVCGGSSRWRLHSDEDDTEEGFASPPPESVDAVYTWVNGSEPRHTAEVRRWRRVASAFAANASLRRTVLSELAWHRWRCKRGDSSEVRYIGGAPSFSSRPHHHSPFAGGDPEKEALSRAVRAAVSNFDRRKKRRSAFGLPDGVSESSVKEDSIGSHTSHSSPTDGYSSSSTRFAQFVESLLGSIGVITDIGDGGGGKGDGVGSKGGSISEPEDDLSRYADNGELRFSVRGLLRHAPWVRRVFFVTNGQVPTWLDLSHPRLSVVTHEQIFRRPIPRARSPPFSSHRQCKNDSNRGMHSNSSRCHSELTYPSQEEVEALPPTFSSNAIEANLHRIPTLSRRFLYLNDDTILAAPVTLAADFASPSRGHKLYESWAVPPCREGCPPQWLGDGQCDAPCNSRECGFDMGDCAAPTNTPNPIPTRTAAAPARGKERLLSRTNANVESHLDVVGSYHTSAAVSTDSGRRGGVCPHVRPAERKDGGVDTVPDEAACAQWRAEVALGSSGDSAACSGSNSSSNDAVTRCVEEANESRAFLAHFASLLLSGGAMPSGSISSEKKSKYSLEDDDGEAAEMALIRRLLFSSGDGAIDVRSAYGGDAAASAVINRTRAQEVTVLAPFFAPLVGSNTNGDDKGDSEQQQQRTDYFSASLQRTNMLLTRSFGPWQRRVPAHMVHLWDRRVLADMWGEAWEEDNGAGEEYDDEASAASCGAGPAELCCGDGRSHERLCGGCEEARLGSDEGADTPRAAMRRHLDIDGCAGKSQSAAVGGAHQSDAYWDSKGHRSLQRGWAAAALARTVATPFRSKGDVQMALAHAHHIAHGAMRRSFGAFVREEVLAVDVSQQRNCANVHICAMYPPCSSRRGRGDPLAAVTLETAEHFRRLALLLWEEDLVDPDISDGLPSSSSSSSPEASPPARRATFISNNNGGGGQRRPAAVAYNYLERRRARERNEVFVRLLVEAAEDQWALVRVGAEPSTAAAAGPLAAEGPRQGKLHKQEAPWAVSGRRLMSPVEMAVDGPWRADHAGGGCPDGPFAPPPTRAYAEHALMERLHSEANASTSRRSHALPQWVPLTECPFGRPPIPPSEGSLRKTKDLVRSAAPDEPAAKGAGSDNIDVGGCPHEPIAPFAESIYNSDAVGRELLLSLYGRIVRHVCELLLPTEVEVGGGGEQCQCPLPSTLPSSRQGHDAKPFFTSHVCQNAQRLFLAALWRAEQNAYGFPPTKRATGVAATATVANDGASLGVSHRLRPRRLSPSLFYVNETLAGQARHLRMHAAMRRAGNSFGEQSGGVSFAEAMAMSESEDGGGSLEEALRARQRDREADDALPMTDRFYGAVLWLSHAAALRGTGITHSLSSHSSPPSATVAGTDAAERIAGGPNDTPSPSSSPRCYGPMAISPSFVELRLRLMAAEMDGLRRALFASSEDPFDSASVSFAGRGSGVGVVATTDAAAMYCEAIYPSSSSNVVGAADDEEEEGEAEGALHPLEVAEVLLCGLRAELPSHLDSAERLPDASHEEAREGSRLSRSQRRGLASLAADVRLLFFAQHKLLERSAALPISKAMPPSIGAVPLFAAEVRVPVTLGYTLSGLLDQSASAVATVGTSGNSSARSLHLLGLFAASVAHGYDSLVFSLLFTLQETARSHLRIPSNGAAKAMESSSSITRPSTNAEASSDLSSSSPAEHVADASTSSSSVSGPADGPAAPMALSDIAAAIKSAKQGGARRPSAGLKDASSLSIPSGATAQNRVPSDFFFDVDSDEEGGLRYIYDDPRGAPATLRRILNATLFNITNGSTDGRIGNVSVRPAFATSIFKAAAPLSAPTDPLLWPTPPPLSASQLQNSLLGAVGIGISVAEEEEGEESGHWMAFKGHTAATAAALRRHFLRRSSDPLASFLEGMQQYSSETISVDASPLASVSFAMVRRNATVVRAQCDDVRAKRPKFLCLNDDMDHAALVASPHTTVARKNTTESNITASSGRAQGKGRERRRRVRPFLAAKNSPSSDTTNNTDSNCSRYEELSSRSVDADRAAAHLAVVAEVRALLESYFPTPSAFELPHGKRNAFTRLSTAELVAIETAKASALKARLAAWRRQERERQREQQSAAKLAGDGFSFVVRPSQQDVPAVTGAGGGGPPSTSEEGGSSTPQRSRFEVAAFAVRVVSLAAAFFRRSLSFGPDSSIEVNCTAN